MSTLRPASPTPPSGHRSGASARSRNDLRHEVSGNKGPGQVTQRGPRVLDAQAAIASELKHHHLSRTFPQAVLKEVDALVANPGIDDPTLVDLTGLPFVSADNGPVESRDPADEKHKQLYSLDLDQAFHLEKTAQGVDFYYAITDGPYYVHPTRTPALFKESLRRRASYYLPDGTVPMLPKTLSEGIMSLNPGVDRRAIVYKISLDEQGNVLGSEQLRARIRSRAQLTYKGVQAYFDDPSSSPLAGTEYTASLDLVRQVGQARLRIAEANDVPVFNRAEVELKLDPSDPLAE